MKLNRTSDFATVRSAERICRPALLRTWLPALLGFLSAAQVVGAETERQSSAEAWWTGPLLAANAATLPQGHILVEPYIFDSMVEGRYDREGRRHSAPRASNFGLQGYALYGLTDSISAGLIPRLGFAARGADGESNLRIGDLGLQAQYGLTKFREGSWIPTTSLVLGETLPTGRYDRLGNHPASSSGGGVYTTSLAVYSQYLFWLPTGRILRTRLDLTYAISGAASVNDVSVYGTTAGFRGSVHAGNSFIADAAWEYSLTRHWVLALDLVYEHDSNTRLAGLVRPGRAVGFSAVPIQWNSGSARSLGLAPAIEYNFNSRLGVIAGAKLTPAGRNTADVIIPVAAINIVI